jgi:hypothetical protein
MTGPSRHDADPTVLTSDDFDDKASGHGQNPLHRSRSVVTIVETTVGTGAIKDRNSEKKGLWNAETIRESIEELHGLVQSPSFNIEDFELPEWVGARFLEIPEQVHLLDVECFEVMPAKCVLTMSRQRNHDIVHFASSCFLLFKDCFWLIQVETRDNEAVGEREGAVARRILEKQ